MAGRQKYRWPSGLFGTVCELVSWVAGSAFVVAVILAIYYCCSAGEMPQAKLEVKGDMHQFMAQQQETFRGYEAIAISLVAAEAWFLCRVAIVLVHIRDRLDQIGPPKSDGPS